MTPEQREQLKQEALLYNKACEVPWPCPISESAKDRFYDAVTPDAILSLIAQVEELTVPQGWKLVPIEPTIKMIAALGYAGDEILAVGHGLISKGIADDYAAMLDAAPTIPAIPGTKEGA